MAEPGPRRNVIRLVLGYGLAIAALGFAAHTLGLGLRQLATAPSDAGAVNLLLAGLLLLVHTLINREAYVRLSLGTGVPITAPTLRRIWAQSLLAKYVPGGIWQLFGRALLMQQRGSTARTAWYIGILEQATSLGLCSAIALAGWFVLAGDTLVAASVSALALVGLAAAPRLLPGLPNRRQAFLAALGYALAMPFYLAAYACLANLPLMELATWVFAGTGAGMLAILVPGGIGVREAVASLLAGNQGSQLMAAMVMARVATLAVEFLLTTRSWLAAPRGVAKQ